MLYLPKIKARFAATVSRVRVCLDFPSVLAIAYAHEALKRAGLPDVSPALIHRRALAVYIEHLDNPANSVELEAQMLQASSAFQPMTEERRQRAFQRLNDAPQDQPLQPFFNVLTGFALPDPVDTFTSAAHTQA